MPSEAPNSHVDVLIIGAGPAGLMAANWMSRLGIKTRIVDKREEALSTGQADGLQPRTLEIWDSFGIADGILKEAIPVSEFSFWNPDESGKLRRSNRLGGYQGISRFDSYLLHQGAVERLLQKTIHEHSEIRVERAVIPEKLEFDESDTEEYPLSITVRHLTKDEAIPDQGSDIVNTVFQSNLVKDDTDDLIKKGQDRGYFSEVVKAKYVFGCDGAHSWTRRQLGFNMEGEQTEYIWGVVDIIPITDFPDIRSVTTIHSASSGTVLIIPRENKIVRLYIQLQDLGVDQPFDRSTVTPETILIAANKILDPYKLSYVHCHWWTVYRIGQRVSNSFSKGNRIFLAGDAVHTHSPKAGQGQNVSMQDTYNLGWKVALVLQKKLLPSVLDTYASERRPFAQELIDFDHKLSRAFSQKPKSEANQEIEQDGVSMEEFQGLIFKNTQYMSGTHVNYPPSPLTIKPIPPVTSKQHLATDIPLGMRFPSYQVLSQADKRPWPLQAHLTSDGRFRILIFGGDISQPASLSRINKLGSYLQDELLPQYIHKDGKKPTALNCIIDVLLVHCAPRDSIELLRDLHNIYHPFDEEFGYDYDKVFVDEVSYGGVDGKAYENYGVSKERGCVVIVRPDQYVSHVLDIKDEKEIDAFFRGILVPQGKEQLEKH